MTISTFSSVRRISRVWLPLALAVLLTATVLLVWGFQPNDRGQPSGQKVAATRQTQNALWSALQNNFDLATREAEPSRSRMTVMPHDNSAGLVCNPASLDRNTPAFRMVLPASPTNRRGVLAALTPEGRLRIIYVSYGFDTDPDDLSVPYSAIEWQHVRTRNDFVVDVSKFEVLNPDADSSEPLFQDAGIYQFALLNSIDRDMLDNNGAPFWAIAGCVVRWQP